MMKQTTLADELTFGKKIWKAGFWENEPQAEKQFLGSLSGFWCVKKQKNIEKANEISNSQKPKLKNLSLEPKATTQTNKPFRMV